MTQYLYLTDSGLEQVSTDALEKNQRIEGKLLVISDDTKETSYNLYSDLETLLKKERINFKNFKNSHDVALFLQSIVSKGLQPFQNSLYSIIVFLHKHGFLITHRNQDLIESNNRLTKENSELKRKIENLHSYLENNTKNTPDH